MADTSHLEKLGRELKCPICLSLLNSAVSLGCNHVFCSSCITKSMKSRANCPVCKVPYHRRDVRPAPHMDNLVSIYRNMETDAGVNMFVTQAEQSVESSDGLGNDKSKKASCNLKSGKCRGKSKRKHVPEDVKQTEDGNDRTCQLSKLPSFQANKRVHVAPYPIPETPYAEKPLKLGELDTDCKTERSLEVDVHGNKNNMSTTCNEAATCNNNDGIRLSPFFWLRDDVETDELSQDFHQTEEHSSGMLTPNFPSFTVIKDSFEDNTLKMTPPSKVADAQVLDSELKNAQVFDGEMFEWTQATCSPELCSIPTIQQNHQSSGEPLVPASSNQENGTQKQKSKRSKKTHQQQTAMTSDNAIANFLELSPKFSVKPSQEEHGGNQNTEVTVRKLIEGREGNISLERSNYEPTKMGQQIQKSKGPKRKMIKRTKIRDTTVALKKSAHNKTNLCSRNGDTSNDTGSMLFQKEKPKRTGEQIVGSEATVILEKKLPLKSNETEMDKKLQKVSEHGVAEISAKPNSDDVASVDWLRKCGGTSVKMKCAFCQSSDVTEVSGEMLHYFNGRPVAADHNGRINVIYSHRHCVEWAPNVYFEDGIVMNLSSEIARSKRIKCSCCAIKGAALGCYEKSCRKSFHFTCAKLMPQCRWDDENFVMLCPVHLASKLPKEISQSGKQRERKLNARREQQGNETINPRAEGKMPWKWPLGSSHKWVLCFSALSKSEKELVSDFAKLTGVLVSKEWKSNVTHVIASTDENGACRRTLKVLLGITEGKWILKIDWLGACLSAGKPVGEEEFEIKMDNHGICDGPRLGRMRGNNKEPGIFLGVKFFFMGDFHATYKGHLQELVIAAGGSVMQRKPIPRDKMVDGSDMHTYIIYSCEIPEKHCTVGLGEIINRRCEEAKKLADASGAKVVSNAWILDSIASCKLLSLDL